MVGGKANFFGHSLRRVVLNEGFEGVEVLGVISQEIVVEPVLRDDDLRERIEQRQVAFWQDCEVVGGDLGGLGSARIDHDDLRIALIASKTLVKDWVSNGEVRPDENDDIGLLKISVSVGRSVEAKRLLVGHY